MSFIPSHHLKLILTRKAPLLGELVSDEFEAGFIHGKWFCVLKTHKTTFICSKIPPSSAWFFLQCQVSAVGILQPNHASILRTSLRGFGHHAVFVCFLTQNQAKAQRIIFCVNEFKLVVTTLSNPRVSLARTILCCASFEENPRAQHEELRDKVSAQCDTVASAGRASPV